MAVTNKQTMQPPMTATGKSGTQIVRLIPGARVYLKASESLTAAPQYSKKTQASGELDASYTGWTDLGIVKGVAKVTYEKKTAEVKTGLDQVLRASYVESKTATLEFVLEQFDDVALEAISGLSASVITSGSIVSYQIGQEDVVTKAILLVVTSKVDGKEIQLYNPAADLNFSYDTSGDTLAFSVTAGLKAFTATGQSSEGFFTKTIFA